MSWLELLDDWAWYNRTNIELKPRKGEQDWTREKV